MKTIMEAMTFNKENIRRVPINRNSLFYDKESYGFELEIGKDFIEQDMGQTVVLYQVDASTTSADAVYGETNPNDVKFQAPIEIPCVYKIDEPELKSYDKQKQLGTYMKMGKLTVSVYQETLDELGVDMLKGDYIGVQVNPTTMAYWVITNDGKNNYDNKHTLWGTIPEWRTILASPVDRSEFEA
jgi:hypothetical protein